MQKERNQIKAEGVVFSLLMLGVAVCLPRVVEMIFGADARDGYLVMFIPVVITTLFSEHLSYGIILAVLAPALSNMLFGHPPMNPPMAYMLMMNMGFVSFALFGVKRVQFPIYNRKRGAFPVFLPFILIADRLIAFVLSYFIIYNGFPDSWKLAFEYFLGTLKGAFLLYIVSILCYLILLGIRRITGLEYEKSE